MQHNDRFDVKVYYRTQMWCYLGGKRYKVYPAKQQQQQQKVHNTANQHFYKNKG